MAHRMRTLLDAMRRTDRLIAATVGFAIVAAVFAGLAVTSLRDHRALERQRIEDVEILDAARSGVLAMISIRDTSAPDDVKKVLDQSTGAFQKDFEARSASFVSVVQEAKVVTTGDVLAQGIESREDGTATVLVYATSSVTNAAGAENETRTWRLRVTLTDDSSRYKMSNVEFVA
jgi:Mce-associated membrane protein